MGLGAAAASMKARIKPWIQTTSRHPAPCVIVVRHHDDHEAAEIRAVDLHGNVIKSIQIRRPIVGPLSIHGDQLCASHGWGLTSVVDMATGAVADVGVDHRKKVNSATPYCVLGHVPATGEYKVLRIQADYCCRRRRQMCEVITLDVGGGGDAGTWRRRTCPPVTLWTTTLVASSRNVVVVAGLAYFLGVYNMEDGPALKADSIAVFDLATEEWKPKTLQGPLTSSILADGDDGDEIVLRYKNKIPNTSRVYLLCRSHFQLAKLGESLVVVYCNLKKSLMELWFMEGMEDDGTTARWSKRYTLRGTLFGDDRYSPQYHYPLAVLGDGRILVWVERTSKLNAYDPETCTWTDLATLSGDCVVGVHRVCSSLGRALPSCTIL